MYLNINYPSGVALIANVLALICHTVQFIYLAKFQDPANWATKIPPKYIMTFISGVDSCLTAYYFIRSRYIVKRKSIFIIFVSLCIAIASIVLNAIHEDTKPWTNGEIYYGAMYYGACSTIEDDNSRLRCQLIDATFVLLIISIGCWFVALFADKPEQKKNSKTTDLEKQSPTSMSNSKNTDIEKQSPLSKSSDSTTSSTIAASKKTNRNSNKPPKQLPVITMTDEDQSADEGVSEVTKLLVTSTKTEVIKEKRISSISDHMRSSIQDTDITPLKALDPSTEPSRSYVGRRSVSADPKPIEPTIAEEKKNDSTEKEPEKTTNDK